jgi:hypothetical protein
MFLDSFGVDLFLALCALFMRHNLELGVAVLLILVLKGIYRWGPVPGFWLVQLFVPVRRRTYSGLSEMSLWPTPLITVRVASDRGRRL